MSCDGARREWWRHWTDWYFDNVPPEIRDLIQDQFADWMKKQMESASKGGSGRKRSQKRPGSGPTPQTPPPPTQFSTMDDVFMGVKKSAELRTRDWTAGERREMEKKYDALRGWLETNAELSAHAKRPVKGDSEYPRISSLAAFAAVWDFVEWTTGLPRQPSQIPEPVYEGPGTAPRVLVFFYGSYINPAVLAGNGLQPDRHEPAHVEDFELVIAPLANLVPSPGSAAYGIVATTTHAELQRLYEEHAWGVLGGRYLPQAVMAQTGDGNHLPALTYVSHDMVPEPADPDYLDLIAAPAREYGFPQWYLAHIESFRSARP